jgi:hypothetical protein
MLKTRLLLGALLAGMLLAAGVGYADAGNDDLISAVQASARFHDLDTAKAAGYGELRDAQGIACIAQPNLGTMGIHYVKGDLVGDAAVDPSQPEALVYEPERNGELKLVALEYVVFQTAWDAAHSSPPSLFEHEFLLTPSPNRYGLPAFYALHAWIWQPNPSGKFEPWNPRVSCSGS